MAALNPAERDEMLQTLLWVLDQWGLEGDEKVGATIVKRALEEPLKSVAHHLPDHVPLRRVRETDGRSITVVGIRLPGWTGGVGFYLWDGEVCVVVRTRDSRKLPAPWQPLILRGHCVSDEWGTHWLQIQEVHYMQ